MRDVDGVCRIRWLLGASRGGSVFQLAQAQLVRCDYLRIIPPVGSVRLSESSGSGGADVGAALRRAMSVCGTNLGGLFGSNIDVVGARMVYEFGGADSSSGWLTADEMNGAGGGVKGLSLSSQVRCSLRL